MKKEIIPLYSWVVRGKQRVAMITALNKLKTPKQLSEETNFKFSNVSDVLQAMRKKNLVRCINPQERMGRLYELTNKGKAVLKELS